MKFTVFILMLVLGFGSATAQRSRFAISDSMVYYGSSDSSDHFYNKNSIEVTNYGYKVIAESRPITDSLLITPSQRYVISLEIDCRNSKYRMFGIKRYKYYTITSTENYTEHSGAWTDMRSGSIMESLKNILCKEK